jgi:hypothetical protein
VLARVISGQKKTAKGEIVNLRESWLPFATQEQRVKGARKGAQIADLGYFLRSKLHPSISGGIGVLTGTDYWGNRQSRIRSALEMFAFLAPLQGVEAGAERGLLKGLQIGMLEFAGIRTTPDLSSFRHLEFEFRGDEFEKKAKSKIRSGARDGQSAIQIKAQAKEELKHEDSLKIIDELIDAEIQKVVHAATDPTPENPGSSASQEKKDNYEEEKKTLARDIEIGKTFLVGQDEKYLRAALRKAMKNQGTTTFRRRHKNKKLTAYGRRTDKLHALITP